MKQLDWQQSALAAILVGAGIVLGTALRTTSEAYAEVRDTAPPTAFQTGGQLSVPVLKEIAGTLREIDGRLARLEVVAAKMQTNRIGAPAVK